MPATTSPTKKERRSYFSPVGTATFVHLFMPHAFPARPGKAPRDPSYSVILSFDAETSKGAEMRAIKQAVVDLAIEKFGADALEKIKRGKILVPWRPNSDYAEYGEPFNRPGLFMTFKSNTPPGIVDSQARPIMNQNEIYSGCRMRVSFGLWPYDNESKGITILMNNAQKAGNGTRLAGRPDASEEFTAIEGADDGDRDDEDDGDGI